MRLHKETVIHTLDYLVKDYQPGVPDLPMVHTLKCSDCRWMGSSGAQQSNEVVGRLVAITAGPRWRVFIRRSALLAP